MSKRPMEQIDLLTVTTTEAAADLLLEAYRGAHSCHILHAANLRSMGEATHARLVERAKSGAVRVETDRAVARATLELRQSSRLCQDAADAILILGDHHARLFVAEADAQASLFPPPREP